ncbi:pilus assembly protein TadG-related protein [Antarcticirhabdus aurantiaca]|uniref:Pilus assembly protein n=2 Tax=Antarcticirhabdus aurantiaca TaxID=2606717 RepID=A0ACD4NPU6_9HYPH|nr:pilus assembly protein [Jeongeuplla avenae]
MSAASFILNKRGNIATASALLAVPLIFAMGAGIDLSRVWTERSKLQTAVDGAALAVMKNAAFKQAEAERLAARMLATNFGSNYQALAVTFSEFGATVTARTKVDLTLAKVLGFESLDAGVAGTAEYPPTKYEIALVLDTTGSMAGSKLAEMKKAAKSMVRELTETEILRRRVKFSLVPFSSFVNVGADKASADWIDGEGAVNVPYSIIPAGVSRFDVFRNLDQTWNGCVETRLETGDSSYGSDDTPPDAKDPNTLFVPLLVPPEPASTRGARYNNSYLTNPSLSGLGVGIDDDVTRYVLAPIKTLLTGPSTTKGPNAGCDVRPIRALTQDYTAITRDIDALKAAGNTNIAEGVAWGNRVLSPGEPFAEGQSFDADVEKIMIVLTDGDNTVASADNPNLSAYSSFGYVADGRWNGSVATTSEPTGCYLSDDVDDTSKPGKKPKVKHDKHGKKHKDLTDPTPVNCLPRPADVPKPKDAPKAATVAAAMDGMTQRACDAAKEKGVELFTIRLEVDTATSSALLKGCASDASHYYDVSDAAQLQAIFDDIANRIKTLRISS